jgi:putative membrane protein
VVVVVVAIAGTLTAAVPGFFALAPYLPLTPAVQGLRAVVSEGGGVVAAAGLLLGWLLLAISASVLAVTRRRMLPRALHPSDLPELRRYRRRNAAQVNGWVPPAGV